MELMQRDDFTCIEKAHFGDDNRENVSRVIGHRHLKNGFTQCVVVIRGTDGVEWTGNMDVLSWDTVSSGQLGDNDYVHYNFNLAKQVLINEIISYISDHRLDVDKTSLIITGHSRGGAVANLVAKDLTDNNDFEPSVTAYTFATPNVAIYDSSMETYNNIFNFCKKNDFIPYIPLVNKDWNYWKYGETYIEITSDDKSYCNDITDLMASERYAQNVFDYYKKTFKYKLNIHLFNIRNQDSYTLYTLLTHCLATPMSKDNNVLVRAKGVLLRLLHISFRYKGLSDISTKLIVNMPKIGVNHMPDKYYQLSFSNYIHFSYNDALACCNVGGLDNADTLNLMSLSNEENENDDNSTPFINVAQKARLMQFGLQADGDNVTNASKLGWDFDDVSTLSGIELDDSGNVISINLSFKDLYGTLNLQDFTSLVSVDVSANYISSINVSGCSSLISLDVSDNELTALDVTALINLESLNCGCNSISSLNLNYNASLIELECSSCMLDTLDVSALADLQTLNCSFNQLSALDVTHNLCLTELYCMLNYIDLSDSNVMTMLNTVESRDNSEVVYEPQFLPKNAVFNADELDALKSFAQQGNNNDVLEFINGDNELDIEAVQCYVQFEKVNGIYRVSAIDISNESITGALNCNSFTYLKELYCSNTAVSNINLNSCQQLEKLYCQNASISNLTLPSNAGTNSSQLCELSCEDNFIDVNIFTPVIISSIESKNDYVLSYKHQNINAPVTMFDENDYNVLAEFAEQNADTLNWDLSAPGSWKQVDWIYNSDIEKYQLLGCSFDCLDVGGTLDLSGCESLVSFSASGTDISTISLPQIDIDDYAFYDCKRLEAVVLTGGTAIGEGAFKFCPALQAVYVPESVTSIDVTAFSGSPNITIAGVSGSNADDFCTENNIPFEAGYFVCGNIITKENNDNSYQYNYPVHNVNVTCNDDILATTDEYGYFALFGLAENEYSYQLTYDYGYDLSLDISVDNSPLIITTPIAMVSFNWNKDAYINAKDYSLLIRQINGNNTGIDDTYFDINKDGTVSREDWQFADKFFLTSNINEIENSYQNTDYDCIPAFMSLNNGTSVDVGIEELVGDSD